MGLVAIFACTLLAACAAESGSPAAGPAVDTVATASPVTIGEIDGAAEYLFGDISSVGVGPGDVVYVADRTGSSVRAYDAAGVFLATVGSEGDGPGEFQIPEDMTFDPAGLLYVRDRVRVTVFGPGGDGPVRDSVVRTFPVGGPGPAFVRAKTDGRVYYGPRYYYYMFIRHAYFYELLDAGGPTGDTVAVPLQHPQILGRANFIVPGQSYGLNLDGVSMSPFEPRELWDITPEGSVLLTSGDRYEIVEVDAVGDTVRSIVLGSQRRSVPGAERRDSARAFEERLDSIPISLDEVNGMSDMARSREVPDVLPEIIGLQVSADGRIWVRRWPSVEGGEETVFDVLDEGGALLHAVRLPVRFALTPPPWVSERFVAGVVVDPVTEVERVAVFEVAVD